MNTINIADTLIHVHENLDVSERRKKEHTVIEEITGPNIPP